jgi:hypothetical protein
MEGENFDFKRSIIREYKNKIPSVGVLSEDENELYVGFTDY